MCLGIPGEVTALVADNDQLAEVDVLGARRRINIGMLADQVLAPGDWVLIHVGFAMDKITEEQAAEALAGLELLGRSSSAAD
jgi:hydrogenase expression/formation protein HypC